MSKNLKVSLILFTIVIVLCPLVLYFFKQKEFANFLLQIFSALGTCGAVFYVIFQSIPKKEKAEGFYYFSPTDHKYPKEFGVTSKELPLSIYITIKNIGEVDIILPDVLHMDIYFGDREWGNIDEDVKNRRIIGIGEKRDFCFPVIFNETLKNIIATEETLKIYAWTEKGVKIKLERTNLYYSPPVGIIVQNVEL